MHGDGVVQRRDDKHGSCARTGQALKRLSASARRPPQAEWRRVRPMCLRLARFARGRGGDVCGPKGLCWELIVPSAWHRCDVSVQW